LEDYRRCDVDHGRLERVRRPRVLDPEYDRLAVEFERRRLADQRKAWQRLLGVQLVREGLARECTEGDSNVSCLKPRALAARRDTQGGEKRPDARAEG
jgi:hypothetical protein